MTISRRALVVAGMHRGGTSATAGALSLLGGALPRDLMPAAAGENPLGFFEPLRIVEVHDELLAEAGSSWHDTSPIPERWFESSTARAFVDRLATVAIAQYGEADLIVLKDPRICRMMPLWLDVLKQLDVTPLFVIPYRHPWEVAASLQRRNGFPFAKSAVMWLQHVLLAEHASRGHGRAFLAYDDLLADPRTVLTRVGRELGIEWRRSGPGAFREVETFLSKEHHHNRASEIAASAPQLPGLVGEACALLATHESGLGVAAEQAFDRIRHAYRIADDLEGPLVRHLSAEVARLTETGAEYERSLEAALDVGNAARLCEVTIERDRGRGVIKGLRLEISSLCDELWRTSEEVARLGREMESRSRGLERSQDEARRLQREVAEQSEALQHARDEGARLRTEVAEQSGALQHARDEGARLRTEVADLSRELRRLENERSDLGFLAARVRREATKEAGVHRLDGGLALRLGLQLLRSYAGRRIVADGRGFFTGAIRYLAADAPRGRNPGIYFDTGFYLEAFPDVRAAGIHPFEHFLRRGIEENRDPCRLFRSAYYLERHPDVAARGGRALPHFLRFGDRERRSPHPLFDPDYYLATYPDLVAARQAPFEHYLRFGAREGRSPHPLFDAPFYLAANPGVAATGVNPLEHYLVIGAARGADPHPRFHTSFYLEANPDVAAAGMNPLEHFVRFGAAEGRKPHPDR